MPVTATAVVAPMVDVVSPATLEEGYSFQAVLNGVVFPVTVPPGGVKEGQTIKVPFQPVAFSELSPLVPSSASTVQGRWKDGIFDCCKYSCMHPSFLNACCCPQILMAQVLTRMNMDWLGEHTTEWESKLTFRRVLIIVIIYYAVSTVLAPSGPSWDDDDTASLDYPDTPIWQHVVYNSLTTAFSVYTVIVLMKLRKAVRTRYDIPVTRCVNQPVVEDCCCSFWCGCCTVAQLARHTANYDERRAVCCSYDGLPSSRATREFVV